jgi:hypothetical protein
LSSDAPDVFVSYNKNDQRWAEWIAWLLEEEGYRVVIQAWDFRPGGNFVLAMHEATRARHTVAVLSPSYLAAEYTHPEWAAAFAADPRGIERKLIPMRVGRCRPDGLLGPIIYVDLVDLGEEEARRKVLGTFAERAKPTTKPSFPGGPSGSASKAPFPRDLKPEISLARLPATGEHFVAREAELGRLDAAWADPRTSLVVLVAASGVGKSTLVNHWLDRLREDGWRGAERVLGWSFYSQGSEATGASGDAFVDYALRWLGYSGDPITSPREKGQELARRVREARTLLVLDGLESLQHPPGSQAGRLEDPALQALLRELQAENAGLCVITTRIDVADVAGRAGVVSIDLDTLPVEAGRLGDGPVAALRAEPIAGLTEGLGAGEENEPITPPTTPLARQFVRLLVGFGVGVGVLSAPFLGTFDVPFFTQLVDVFPYELRKFLFALGAFAMGVVAVAIQFYAGESSSRQRVRRLFSRTLLVIVFALVALGVLLVQYIEEIPVAGEQVASFVIAGKRLSNCPCDRAVSNKECIESLTANPAMIERCWSPAATNWVRLALLGSYLLLTSGFGALIGLLLLQRVAKQQAAARKKSQERGRGRSRARSGGP